MVSELQGLDPGAWIFILFFFCFTQSQHIKHVQKKNIFIWKRKKKKPFLFWAFHQRQSLLFNPEYTSEDIELVVVILIALVIKLRRRHPSCRWKPPLSPSWEASPWKESVLNGPLCHGLVWDILVCPSKAEAFRSLQGMNIRSVIA